MNDLERFNFKVSKAVDGCWYWLGSRNSQGYGWFWYKRRMWMAHRASYELHKGTITNDLLVLHSCNNPPCVNPEHLRLGTSQENNSDMDRLGNRVCNRGVLNPSAKLNEVLVKEIKFFLQAGYSLSKVAELFGISRPTVSHIKAGRTWEHVT